MEMQWIRGDLAEGIRSSPSNKDWDPKECHFTKELKFTRVPPTALKKKNLAFTTVLPATYARVHQLQDFKTPARADVIASDGKRSQIQTDRHVAIITGTRIFYY
jgi:hypothetical protein